MLNNPIICKDSAYLSVWIYLLLKATHAEYAENFKGEKIMLHPGQLITGRKKIAEKLSISESKVTRIINKFISERQIEQQTSNENRLITILNWSEYQGSEHLNEHPVNNERTTNGQPVNTYKNVKNETNIKNNRTEYQKKYSDDSFEIKCINYLISSIKAEMPDAKLPVSQRDIDRWCDYIEKMVRLDKRSKDDIFNVLVFARNDAFWKANIRSTSKLREKYEILYSQMKSCRQPKQKSNIRFNQFPQRAYTAQDHENIEKILIKKNL